MFVVVAIFAILFGGCALPVADRAPANEEYLPPVDRTMPLESPEAPPVAVTRVVLGDFSPEEKQALAAAVTEWHEALSPVDRVVEIADECSDPAPLTAPLRIRGEWVIAEACVHVERETMPGYLGFASGQCNDMTVTLAPRELETMRITLLHEMGHVLGCSNEHLGRDTVMYLAGHAVPHLTDADVAYGRRSAY